MDDTYDRFREEAEKYFEAEQDIEQYVQLRLEGNSAATAFRVVIDSIVKGI